jgi:DNA invertase Pin-like site-specific DNA recombinase
MLQRQRDFQAESSKVDRQLSARWLYKPRQSKAKERDARIREIAKTITRGSRHKLIARAAGCSVATVKRALARK